MNYFFLRFNARSLRLGVFFCLVLSGIFDLKGSTPSVDNWFLMKNDTLYGANVLQATRYASLHYKKKKKGIVVGVIDSGIDTCSVFLRDALWNNPKEKPNGKDSDRNGFTDDLHGWNFLGSRDGSFTFMSAGTQEYREFKRLYPRYKMIHSPLQVSDTLEYAYYQKMKKAARIDTYLQFFDYLKMKQEAIKALKEYAQRHVHDKSPICLADIPAIDSDTLLQKKIAAITPELMRATAETPLDSIESQINRQYVEAGCRIDGIENDVDKRTLIGDDMADFNDRFYGNNRLSYSDATHGTAVAGLIAGHFQDSCLSVFPKAEIMVIRAIPEGDEYDKDVASAIRYAVDNGAKVINMSFGKMLSIYPDEVSRVIEYAFQKDVLLIQAAGNNGINLEKHPLYPLNSDKNGNFWPHMIRVGASDKNGNPCPFSNYGVNQVDIFAPGDEILVTSGGSEFMLTRGTSIAAPIVTGIAAMIRYYFPKLSAAQVKKCLLESTTTAAQPPISSHPAQTSNRDFYRTICKGGGIVDAYEALRLAEKMSK